MLEKLFEFLGILAGVVGVVFGAVAALLLLCWIGIVLFTASAWLGGVVYVVLLVCICVSLGIYFDPYW